MPSSKTAKRNPTKPISSADFLINGNRRASILRAAAHVFFEQGYSAASVDAVIERTGGSKRAIYQEFGSKEGLFHALIKDLADEAYQVLSQRPHAKDDLSQALSDFAFRMMRVQMSPMMLGAYRLVIGEQARFPKLAKLFYERLPKVAVDQLTRILEDAKASGEIDIANCRRAASHFVGMGRDNLHLEVVLGLRTAPTAQQSKVIIATIVAMFLDGVRRRRHS